MFCAMSPIVSLIISTYGRFDEVNLLLESLVVQDCGSDVFEVIIVDQNDIIELDSLVVKFCDKLNITHYKSDVKGLSKAKNKGICLSRGSILTFSDDDCTFYPNTISSAITYFESNTNVDIVYGRLYDLENNKSIMRKWSSKELSLTKFNFHLNYSAVTCFTKVKSLHFNERFGVGSEIGLGEELDYVMQSLILGYKVHYSPKIDIWHPELNVSVMPNEKVYKYAYGYGAVFRKNFDKNFAIIFLMSLIYQLIRLFLNFFKFDFKNMYKMYLGIKGRLIGFIKYKD